MSFILCHTEYLGSKLFSSVLTTFLARNQAILCTVHRIKSCCALIFFFVVVVLTKPEFDNSTSFISGHRNKLVWRISLYLAWSKSAVNQTITRCSLPFSFFHCQNSVCNLLIANLMEESFVVTCGISKTLCSGIRQISGLCFYLRHANLWPDPSSVLCLYADIILLEKKCEEIRRHHRICIITSSCHKRCRLSSSYLTHQWCCSKIKSFEKSFFKWEEISRLNWFWA